MKDSRLPIKYPKIQTLWNRDKETFRLDQVLGLRCAEFSLVTRWHITEKVHGTNIRVGLLPDGNVAFGGRTDRAQIPPFLLSYLQTHFTPERMQTAFEQDETGNWPEAVLFGEGYGEKIQKGGGNYRQGVSFRLFDVWVAGWWLNWANVEDIARKLKIRTVPVLATNYEYLPTCYDELADLFPFGYGYSVVAREDAHEQNRTNHNPLAEGVVARTDPLLFNRRGNRVMWKLKFRDFPVSGS